jgi:isorenieratene synthase
MRMTTSPPTSNSSRRRQLRRFGRLLAPLTGAAALEPRPDWEQADPRWIRRALARSQALPGGGWYVLDATRSFGARPRRMQVEGRQLVVWRAGSQLMAASDACPHMGASLSEGRVCDGKLVCPWHGLGFGPEPGAGAEPKLQRYRTFDDGHLLWLQLTAATGTREPPSAEPYLPARPSPGLDAVIRVEAQCEARDVIANRLDPWHGVHYHPHSFGSLQVVAQDDASITVRVAYRVAGPFAVEVDARFSCPDPRTIVMTIVGGEGLGSVVETHATPRGPGRTAIVELTLASSERAGFQRLAPAHRLLRPVLQWAARRLWVEDARYAERLYALRQLAIATPRTRSALVQQRSGDVET